MHRGYVKLWRRLKDSDMWTAEPFTRGQAWVDLVMLANHKDGFFRVRGQRVDVKRGQLAWSEISLSARWHWSRGKVRRFLSELSSKSVQQIEQHKTRLTSLITILNYDQYQGDGTTDSTTDGTTNGQQTDNRRYTNKNVKNVKNVKNKDTNPSDPTHFDAFWQVYPRKIGKADAIKAWVQQNGSRPGIENIIAKIEQLKRSRQWKADGGRYIPHPATWLRRHGWDDEPETKTAAPGWGDQYENDSRV